MGGPLFICRLASRRVTTRIPRLKRIAAANPASWPCSLEDGVCAKDAAMWSRNVYHVAIAPEAIRCRDCGHFCS